MNELLFAVKVALFFPLLTASASFAFASVACVLLLLFDEKSGWRRFIQLVWTITFGSLCLWLALLLDPFSWWPL